jgi:ammonium transporter, Amt family
MKRYLTLVLTAVLLGLPMISFAATAVAPSGTTAPAAVTKADLDAVSAKVDTAVKTVTDTLTPTISAAKSAGDTAWMLTSAALVLLMTVPGLALFYGGMVRKKNILSTIYYSLGAAVVVSILWVVIQYSLAFGKDVGGVIGNLDKMFMHGVDPTSMWLTIP